MVYKSFMKALWQLYKDFVIKAYRKSFMKYLQKLYKKIAYLHVLKALFR